MWNEIRKVMRKNTNIRSEKLFSKAMILAGELELNRLQKRSLKNSGG